MNQNDIEAMIHRYINAEMAVLDGKSITFNGQQMTMENLIRDPTGAAGVGTSPCDSGCAATGDAGL
ncbi:prophage protein [Escherichia coli]|nr:prophage protein [Escherichia coli]